MVGKGRLGYSCLCCCHLVVKQRLPVDAVAEGEELRGSEGVAGVETRGGALGDDTIIRWVRIRGG